MSRTAMSRTATSRTATSGSVERALHILVALADGPATISEIGRRLGVHRTTSLRLLRSLENEHFVRRRDDGRYRLGPRMTMLAHAALDSADVRSVATHHLHELGAKHGHTVHLGAVENHNVIYLDKVESQHAIRMYSRIGVTAPLHATAVGKAILAHTPQSERDRLLGDPPFRTCTPNTITARADLDRDLEATLRNGWALDHYEHEEIIHCVAAPIFDAANHAIAAVSISAPSVVLDHDGLLALTPDLLDTAHAISEELGWSQR